MDQLLDPETPPSLERFGNYLLLKRLAQGGMAEVMLARPATAAANGRILVVKRMLIISGETLVSREMFQHEIRICSCLNHPNIINLFDFGEVEGQPYIAMEYVQGWTLRTVARRFAAIKRPVPIPLSTLVAAQAAGALHYAHTFRDPASGEPLHIIHRDISPQNIMISISGNIKVIDFGIAKTAIDTARTETGVIKGKVSYLSPEQANQGPLSPATDVFSLGLILWEMLAGRKLFDPHLAGSDLAVLERVLEHGGLDASTMPSALNPGVPPELDQIVAKALAPRPCDRHPSADALRRELHDVLVTKYAGFSSPEAADILAPVFAESTARDEALIRQLNQLAQERIEKERKPARPPSNSESRSFSFVDLPELSQRLETSMAPHGGGIALASSAPTPAPTPVRLAPAPPSAGQRAASPEFQLDRASNNVKIALAPLPPTVHARRSFPDRNESARRVQTPVYKESFWSKFAWLVERRWPSVLVGITLMAAFILNHVSTQKLEANKEVQRAPTEVVAPAGDTRTATIHLLIEPYRYSALARVFVNDEEVLPEGDSIKVPLDQKISLRIERMDFYTYTNEFTLDSNQVKPPGVFKLHVNLVAKPQGHHHS